MERIIILLEVSAFVALMVFAFLSNSRRHICRPIHLLNFGIWPLSAFGCVTAVIFYNSETRLIYMPHVIWHVLFIILLIISVKQFRQVAGLEYAKICFYARFSLLFAAFTEALAIMANMVNCAL
jgi:hypothetical protein